MIITAQMLEAGIQKAIELGVLPRRTCSDDLATNAEIMNEILQAALEPDAVMSAADPNGAIDHAPLAR